MEAIRDVLTLLRPPDHTTTSSSSRRPLALFHLHKDKAYTTYVRHIQEVFGSENVVELITSELDNIVVASNQPFVWHNYPPLRGLYSYRGPHDHTSTHARAEGDVEERGCVHGGVGGNEEVKGMQGENVCSASSSRSVFVLDGDKGTDYTLFDRVEPQDGGAEHTQPGRLSVGPDHPCSDPQRFAQQVLLYTVFGAHCLLLCIGFVVVYSAHCFFIISCTSFVCRTLLPFSSFFFFKLMLLPPASFVACVCEVVAFGRAHGYTLFEAASHRHALLCPP